MSKLALFRILLLGVFLSACLVSYAQPDLPGDPQTTDPDQVPISGIEILLGIGGLLGAKKYYDLRKKKVSE